MLATMFGRAVFGGMERRATTALGRQAANFMGDTVENIGQNIITDGFADVIEGATGHRPNIHTPVSAGSFGALAYTQLCGQYNQTVAQDVTNGVASHSTMFMLGRTARQTAEAARVAIMTNMNAQS